MGGVACLLAFFTANQGTDNSEEEVFFFYYFSSFLHVAGRTGPAATRENMVRA